MVRKTGQKDPRNNWAAGWEAHPILPATPRWTFGKSLLNSVSHGSKGKSTAGTGEDRDHGRRVRHRVRETYLDELLRAEEDQGTGVHLGPGSHHPLPVDRVFQDPLEEVHGKGAIKRRNAGAGGVIQQTRRLASLSSFRQYRRTDLPTCAHTPGPGAYDQFTTFGQASGPTRNTYVPKAAADAPTSARLHSARGKKSLSPLARSRQVSGT